jgi:hypothetical protein
MPTKTKKTAAGAPADPVPEADFDDTIAHNRAVPVLDPAHVPHPPKGYRATDPDTRGRRLRRLAAELRSEAGDALREAEKRDLKHDLGKYAPDAARATVLLDRITTSGQLVNAVQTLLNYAKEIDQIALSDTLVFLEAENKQLAHALDHEPGLATHYPAVIKLFSARADAIVEGIARAKDGAAAAKPQKADGGTEAPAADGQGKG